MYSQMIPARWRGELRFRSEDPNSPIGFSIQSQANSQDRVISNLMEMYKSVGRFMEVHYTNALARMSQQIEELAEIKHFVPAAFHKQIAVTPHGSTWLAELRFSDLIDMKIPFEGESKEDVSQRANACYTEMITYMNNRFVQRLTRLSEFLATNLSDTLVAWERA